MSGTKVIVDRLLVALRAAAAGALPRDLAAATGIAPNKISVVCGRFADRGWCERLDDHRYRLTPSGRRFAEAAARGARIGKPGPKGRFSGVRRVRKETFRDRLWRALRMKLVATTAELIELAYRPADQPDRHAAAEHARRFLKRLADARVVARSLRPRRGEATWRLVKDLGPQTPLFRGQGKGFFDPNARKAVEC